MPTDKTNGHIPHLIRVEFKILKIHFLVTNEEISVFRITNISTFVVCSLTETGFLIRAHRWYPWLNSSRLILLILMLD